MMVILQHFPRRLLLCRETGVFEVYFAAPGQRCRWSCLRRRLHHFERGADWRMMEETAAMESCEPALPAWSSKR